MKKIIFLSCFFIGILFNLLAQRQPSLLFYLNNIPKDGIVINKGWKFHAGDDQQWSDSSFNSNNWDNIDPTKNIYFLPQVRAAQIGWLQVKLRVGKELRGKTVAFIVRQAGASEIYLNGRLIRQYGKVSRNYDQEETYNPGGQPLTIQLGDGPEQVLAVRYSFNRHNLYFGKGPEVFNISITQPASAWDYYINNIMVRAVHRALIFGVFILLAILQLFIYLTYRTRKTNLYLSLFSFCQSFAFSQSLLLPLFHSSSVDFFIIGAFYIAAHITFIFFLLIVYDLFNRPPKLWFGLLAGMSLFAIPIEFLQGYFQQGTRPASLALTGSALLIYIEITRISVIAFRHKNPGSKLFLLGQVITLTGFIITNSVNMFYSERYTVGILNFMFITNDITFLTPAIVISVLLAREFTQNNISLKQKLKQVEELSEKNLAHEIEKQHLLASQNEMLEK